MTQSLGSTLFFVLASLAAGCSLVQSTGASIEYALDPASYTQRFADPTSPASVPEIACDAVNDPCAGATLPSGGGALGCDVSSGRCELSAELRLLHRIELAAASAFPRDVIEYGADAVKLKKITYWIRSSTLGFDMPAIDLFVAPAVARDEYDPRAVRVGTIAALAARSSTCGDPADEDREAGGGPVCALPLRSEGVAALEAQIRDYKTPFQLIAHAVVKSSAGKAIPAGTIDFSVRPTVVFDVLK